MQAEALGNVFRTVMYPGNGPSGGGFLRLHSTYRHDLKIYSSDEGRVQMSAAAFTQGLLDLEGSSLTPILVRYGNQTCPWCWNNHNRGGPLPPLHPPPFSSLCPSVQALPSHTSISQKKLRDHGKQEMQGCPPLSLLQILPFHKHSTLSEHHV